MRLVTRPPMRPKFKHVRLALRELRGLGATFEFQFGGEANVVRRRKNGSAAYILLHVNEEGTRQTVLAKINTGTGEVWINNFLSYPDLYQPRSVCIGWLISLVYNGLAADNDDSTMYHTSLIPAN